MLTIPQVFRLALSSAFNDHPPLCRIWCACSGMTSLSPSYSLRMNISDSADTPSSPILQSDRDLLMVFDTCGVNALELIGLFQLIYSSQSHSYIEMMVT